MRKLEKSKLKKVIPAVKNIAITLISLFAGCGGSSLGYEMAGFIELLAIEWDAHARKVFALNFPKVKLKNIDIEKLTGKQLLKLIGKKRGELDVFDASPPCQGFSQSDTSRDVNNEKNKLYFKTIELIKDVQPKVFCIENVVGMRRGKMKAAWNNIVEAFEKLNYRVEFKVVKAEQFNVPQARRRVIVMGVRNDIQKRFNIGELFPQTKLTNVKKMSVGAHIPNVIGFSPGQFQDRFIPATEPMCTITKTMSAWFYEEDGLRRRPTIPELKVLSSFPESFKFLGSFNQQWARIGNAVPPNITKSIGLHIKENILTQEVLNHFSPTVNIDSNEDMRIAA
ncbi:MAG: DNA (cytosine-5)-methyltransferase 1 [Crocinitomicaceae bacterium]|jgi:DNA (cytosine-5)-methyltransferase 1